MNTNKWGRWTFFVFRLKEQVVHQIFSVWNKRLASVFSRIHDDLVYHFSYSVLRCSDEAVCLSRSQEGQYGTYKAVCFFRTRTASCTLRVATVLRAWTKTPAMTLQCTHRLCHWNRDRKQKSITEMAITLICWDLIEIVYGLCYSEGNSKLINVFCLCACLTLYIDVRR